MPGYCAVTLRVNQYEFESGEPITLSLTVTNQTQQPIRLQFRDSQRYDFVIENETGKIVWRWSEGHLFAQMLGEESVGPERPELQYTETCSDNLQPGRYKITGSIADQETFASASVWVVVR